MLRLILLLTFILGLRFVSLGLYELYDSTESRYAGIAFRMAESGDFVTPWFLPNIPFLGKPPLSFWATAISFKVFNSYHEFFARLPHFLICLVILYITFIWAKKMSNTRNGLISAIVLASMVGFQLLAGSVMTDAFLLFGIVLTNFGFFYGFQSKKYGYLFFAGIAISILSKGLTGVVLTGLPCFFYCMIRNKWKDLFKFPIFTGLIMVIVLVLPWFYLMQQANPDFFEYFFMGEHFKRFTVSSWEGDRYGYAHSYPLFTIWVFFFAITFQWGFYSLYLIFKERTKISFKNIKDDTLFVLLTLFCPLLFLSFAKNIIIPYATVSIYSLAIIIGVYFKKSEKVLFALTIPFVLLYFVFLIIGTNFVSTDKALIFEFEKVKGKENTLYYLEKPRFSSYFYSRDHAFKITPEELLKKQGIFFISLTEEINAEKLKCNKERCLYKKI